MKYTISINQKVLEKTKLDLIDCAILDWIIAMCNSTSEKIIEARIDGWTWIDYGQLLKDMPLLRIKSKGAITPRIKKLVDEFFIETDLKDGEKMFVKLTEKVDSLYFDTVHENEQSVHEDERNRSPKRTPPFTKMNQSYNYNHNTKIKNTYGEFKKVFLTVEEYEKLIERMGEKNTELMIAELDSYIASKGKRYSSHYATILTWARRKIVDYKKTKSNIAF